MKSLMIAGLALVLAPMLYTGAANAQETKTMRIGLATAATHIQNTGSEAFKKFIEEKTNGAIKVEIYPGAQLGDNKAMLDSVKIGAVDGIFPSPADLGNIDKNFNIMNFPFLFSSQEVANRVTDGPWGDKMLALLDQYGYKGLAIVDSGFRQTTNSKHAIKSLDDFKGLKIRMQPNPLHLDIFRALGANPAPLSFAELFSALQQGVMDGQENPLNNIYSSKLHEVQKYVTLDGHIYDTNIFLVGKTFYEGPDAGTAGAVRRRLEDRRRYDAPGAEGARRRRACRHEGGRAGDHRSVARIPCPARRGDQAGRRKISARRRCDPLQRAGRGGEELIRQGKAALRHGLAFGFTHARRPMVSPGAA